MVTALTVYPTSTAATTVTTGRTLATAAPAAEASTTTKVAKSTGWGNLFPQGSTANWLAGASSPALGANGAVFLLDDTSLEGKAIVAGAWTPKIKVSCSSAITMAIQVHVGVRHSDGTYTAIGSSQTAATAFAAGTAQSLTLPTINVATNTQLAVGDKLAIDFDANVTVATASTTATISLFMNGGAAESVATPGYFTSIGAATSESATVTDATAANVLHATRVIPGETPGVTDSTTPARGVSRGLAETSTASDSTARVVRIARGTTETPTAGDVVARGPLSFGRADVEAATVTDAAGRSVRAGRGAVESPSVTDSSASATQSQGLSRSTTETASVTDTSSVTRRAFTRAASESAPAADAAGRTVRLGRLLTEAAAVADAATTRSHEGRAQPAEVAPASDATTRSTSVHASSAEVAPAVDATALLVALVRATSEDATVDDATAFTVATARSTTEVAPVDDSTSPQAARVAASTSEVATVSDSTAAFYQAVLRWTFRFMGEAMTAWQADVPQAAWRVGAPYVAWAAGVAVTAWRAGKPETAFSEGAPTTMGAGDGR